MTSPATPPAEPSVETPAVPPQPPVSIWEDFVDIFYAPSAVFARRRSAGFVVPLIVLVVVVSLLFLASRPFFASMVDAETTRALARAAAAGHPVSAAQAASAREWTEKLQGIMVPIGTIVNVFIVAAVLLVIARFFDVVVSYAAACMIATYAQFPRILQHVAGLVQAYFLSPDALTSHLQITLSLARFFDPDATPLALLALLARVDLFTIWVTILLGIGIAVVGQTTRQRATFIAVTLWILGTLVDVLSALRV